MRAAFVEFSDRSLTCVFQKTHEYFVKRRMTMKKFLATLLARVMVLSLAACGGDKGGDTTPPADSGNTGTTAPPADSGSGEKTAIKVIAAEYGQNTRSEEHTSEL